MFGQTYVYCGFPFQTTIRFILQFFSFLVPKNDRVVWVTIDNSSSNKTTFCQMYFEKYLFYAAGETLFDVKRASP